MKLAVISSSAPFGKGESFVVNEVNAIAVQGQPVILIPTQLRRGSPNHFDLNRDVKLLALASLSFKVLGGFCLFGIQSPKRLVRLTKLIRDNKSFLNSLKNFLVLPKAIWLSRYLTLHSVEHIHAHWLTTSATLALVCSELTGIPWSCTAHRGDIVANNLLDIKFRSATFVRFISESGLKLARARAEISTEKSHVLHIGVSIPDLQSNNNGDSVTPLENEFTVVCPANLIPVKGHRTLIDALAEMQLGKHVKLIFAGDGELRQKLESQVKMLGLESHVSFKGHVAHSELISWYENKLVDLVVLPSLDLGNGLHEGIPVSLMEAMSYGIPVISTRTGGIPELLEDTAHNLKFGCIVDAGDSQSLATEMDKMVESIAYREKWQKLGRARVKETFNNDKTISALLKLIKQHTKECPET